MVVGERRVAADNQTLRQERADRSGRRVAVKVRVAGNVDDIGDERAAIGALRGVVGNGSVPADRHVLSVERAVRAARLVAVKRRVAGNVEVAGKTDRAIRAARDVAVGRKIAADRHGARLNCADRAARNVFVRGQIAADIHVGRADRADLAVCGVAVELRRPGNVQTVRNVGRAVGAGRLVAVHRRVAGNVNRTEDFERAGVARRRVAVRHKGAAYRQSDRRERADLAALRGVAARCEIAGNVRRAGHEDRAVRACGRVAAERRGTAHNHIALNLKRAKVARRRVVGRGQVAADVQTIRGERADYAAFRDVVRCDEIAANDERSFDVGRAVSARRLVARHCQIARDGNFGSVKRAEIHGGRVAR